MECSFCRRNIEKNSKFCKHCGKKINIKKRTIKVGRTYGFVVGVAVVLFIVALLIWGVVAYAMFSPTGYMISNVNSVKNHPSCRMHDTNECKNKGNTYTMTDLNIKSNCVETKDECLKYLFGLCVKKKTICVKKLVTCGLNLNNYGDKQGMWKMRLKLLNENLELIDSKIRSVDLGPHRTTKNYMRNHNEEFCGMNLSEAEEETLEEGFEDIGVITGFTIAGKDIDKQLSCDFDVLSEHCS